MAAEAAQAGDLGQHLKRAALFVGCAEVVYGLLAQGFVLMGFGLGQRHLVGDFGARGQLIEHLAFQATQDEGLDQVLLELSLCTNSLIIK